MSRAKKTKKTAAPSDAKIATAFERFVASGYAPKLFTKDLYQELSQCFGFIAHFDQGGFYEARFGGSDERMQTLFVMGKGDVGQPLSALEQRLRILVLDKRWIGAAREQIEAEIERHDLAEFTRLKAKYEPWRTP